MKKKISLFISFLALIALFVAPHSFSKTKQQASPKQAKQITEEDKLYVECIKDKGLIFYGTSWCPHCKQQKATFGELMSQINYVDCEQDSKACRTRKVTGYPTLLLPDGKEIGQGTIKDIAEDCGCNINQLKASKQQKPASNEPTLNYIDSQNSSTSNEIESNEASDSINNQ